MHAGDFVAASVLEELCAFAPVEAVHGNMDDAALRATLPETTSFEAEGVRVGVVHDAGPRQGRHERLVARFPGCAVVVCGHTHLPEVARVGDVWVLNPGSPTERRRAPARTIARLWIDPGTARLELVTLGT